MRNLLFAGAALLFGSLSAQAGTFDATSFSVIGGENVSMTSPKVQTVSAGEVTLSGPSGNIDVWCVDLLDVISLPYLYSTGVYVPGSSVPGMPTLDATQTHDVADLIENGQGTGATNAEIQVAIWEILYGSNFVPVGLTAPFSAEVATLIGESGTLLNCPDCSLQVFTDAPTVVSQSFADVVVAPTPIPGALLLFGSGLIGLVGAGYGAKRKLPRSAFNTAIQT
ncbi:MAG TPA: hypothetical protein VGH47_04525 [Xanthobacteraceae bacterium]|jgi:hypothetical protein